MSALANCFKAKLGGDDVPFFYTMPASSLAPKITKPQSIKGASTAIEIDQWTAAKPNDKEDSAAASARVLSLLDQVVRQAPVKPDNN